MASKAQRDGMTVLVDRAGARHDVHREDGAGEQHGGKAQHRQGEGRLGDVLDGGGGEQAEAERGDRRTTAG